LVQWMDANPKITQVALGRAVGHHQVWVSRFRSGAQDADIDELEAMAKAFGHTLNELCDLRPDPKEHALLEAFRQLTPPNRELAVTLLQALIQPSGREPTRKRSGG
jgi:hypothetical protein